jgi:beta-phosphoglucomutase family hydrolase
MDGREMKSGVIFDMDGVLVDNRDIHIEAFLIYFKRVGLKATYEQLLGIFGKVNTQIFEDLFGVDTFTPEQIERMGAEKERIYRELFAEKVAPMPGLVPFLNALKESGVKIAVGSSGPRENVDFVLEACGITGYFDAIVDGSMVTRGKPDPEVFRKAAALLGKTPGECLVFEDALVGIEAGKRAGMTVIALETTFTKAQLAGSGYDRLIRDFTEVDASVLQEF